MIAYIDRVLLNNINSNRLRSYYRISTTSLRKYKSVLKYIMHSILVWLLVKPIFRRRFNLLEIETLLLDMQFLLLIVEELDKSRRLYTLYR